MIVLIIFININHEQLSQLSNDGNFWTHSNFYVEKYEASILNQNKLPLPIILYVWMLLQEIH